MANYRLALIRKTQFTLHSKSICQFVDCLMAARTKWLLLFWLFSNWCNRDWGNMRSKLCHWITIVHLIRPIVGQIVKAFPFLWIEYGNREWSGKWNGLFYLFFIACFSFHFLTNDSTDWMRSKIRWTANEIMIDSFLQFDWQVPTHNIKITVHDLFIV